MIEIISRFEDHEKSRPLAQLILMEHAIQPKKPVTSRPHWMCEPCVKKRRNESSTLKKYRNFRKILLSIYWLV
jgi:hypothetical protein